MTRMTRMMTKITRARIAKTLAQEKPRSVIEERRSTSSRSCHWPGPAQQGLTCD